MLGGLLPLTERRRSDPISQPNVFEALWSNRRIRAVFIVILSSCLFMTILHVTSNIENILGPTIPPQYSSSVVSGPATKPKEAYAFYLSTQDMDPHYLRTALILLFALTTDPIFQDPQGRDVVVLTPAKTPKADITTLKEAGAKIFSIPNYIDLITDTTGDTPNNFDLGKYEYSKSWLWDLKYDRVVHLSTDLVLNKPLMDVWIDAHANPESGLAATVDIDADAEGGKFGEGFMMIRPDKEVALQLRIVEKDEESFIDRDVLNNYFSREGDVNRPWEPLNQKFLAIHPTGEDITGGVYTLQEKGWTMETNRDVANVWWEAYGRMVGWKETMEEAEQKRMAAKKGGWW